MKTPLLPGRRGVQVASLLSVVSCASPPREAAVTPAPSHGHADGCDTVQAPPSDITAPLSDAGHDAHSPAMAHRATEILIVACAEFYPRSQKLTPRGEAEVRRAAKEVLEFREGVGALMYFGDERLSAESQKAGIERAGAVRDLLSKLGISPERAGIQSGPVLGRAICDYSDMKPFRGPVVQFSFLTDKRHRATAEDGEAHDVH